MAKEGTVHGEEDTARQGGHRESKNGTSSKEKVSEAVVGDGGARGMERRSS
jgi:hypothetical protein